VHKGTAKAATGSGLDLLRDAQFAARGRQQAHDESYRWRVRHMEAVADRVFPGYRWRRPNSRIEHFCLHAERMTTLIALGEASAEE